MMIDMDYDKWLVLSLVLAIALWFAGAGINYLTV